MKVKVVIVDLEVSPRLKKWALRLGIPLALVLGVGTVAYAAGLVTWTDGQKLTAADLNNNFSELQKGGAPSGAVIAFNLSQCPPGWTALSTAAGRTIIGVNAPNGNGLSQRNLGDTAGEETHKMTTLEMPSHSHALMRGGVNGPAGLAIQTPTAPANFDLNASDILQVQSTGGGNAFTNMQPSLALLYCQKS